MDSDWIDADSDRFGAIPNGLLRIRSVWYRFRKGSPEF